MTVDDIVALYVRLRNEKGAIRAKLDEEVSKIDAKLDKYSAEIEDLWKAMDDLIRNPMQ